VEVVPVQCEIVHVLPWRSLRQSGASSCRSPSSRRQPVSEGLASMCRPLQDVGIPIDLHGTWIGSCATWWEDQGRQLGAQWRRCLRIAPGAATAHHSHSSPPRVPGTFPLEACCGCLSLWRASMREPVRMRRCRSSEPAPSSTTSSRWPLENASRDSSWQSAGGGNESGTRLVRESRVHPSTFACRN
jgi:hypothetical protein